MNTRRWISAGIIALLLGTRVSASALDLTQFQSFLEHREDSSSVTTAPKTPEWKPILPLSPQPRQLQRGTEMPDLNEDADASFKNNQLVTLGPKTGARKGDSLSLPAETRIPEGLRPILSDRQTPRQGVSLTGSTGGLLVPSPGVLEPGKTAVAVHAVPFDLYDVTEHKYADASYFDTSVKLVYGLADGFELGVDKTFSNQDRFNIPEPLFVNMKYQVPGNITVGGSFCGGSQSAYNSVWVAAGVPVIWVGVGGNFGPRNFRFSYNGWETLSVAKYGGYNYKYSSAEGYADPVWFMVGGSIPMSNYTNFMYDFNGDKFSLGIRLNYQKVAYIDFSYVSDGDYESLPGAISHIRHNNFVFGGSIVY
ncbi:MAG: hypothetical protein HQM09_20745 [Candidatus Riflebacteria bacterium]|nr:hypothetical protein [Candidatus Riflebacteria bacterium]